MIPSDIKATPFTPSPYCNPDIAEHRRVEKCKDLKGDKEFRSIGTCQHRGCKGKKFYKHILDNQWAGQVVHQGQTTIRKPDRVKESK
jgi:hypothetical protein